MAREVNLFVNNWKKTGVKVSVPQYSVSVTINWTDNEGESHSRSETLKFPNFLTNVGADDLKEWLSELMIREARQRLGVN